MHAIDLSIPCVNFHALLIPFPFLFYCFPFVVYYKSAFFNIAIEKGAAAGHFAIIKARFGASAGLLATGQAAGARLKLAALSFLHNPPTAVAWAQISCNTPPPTKRGMLFKVCSSVDCGWKCTWLLIGFW